MSIFLVLIGIHAVAVASPGPDFFLVMKSSLAGRFGQTMGCCFGIASGVVTHLLFAYFGLSVIINQSKFMYSIIVILGGLWLIKLAVSGFFAKSENWNELQAVDFSSYLIAFKDGYLTNLLNPKALIYFVSVMSPLIQKGVSGWSFFAIACTITIVTFVWFASVATLLHQHKIKILFQKYQAMIDKLFAVIILFFAISILYSEWNSLLA